MKKVIDCPECATRQDPPNTLFVHSGVTNNLRPFVHLAWGGERGQLTPDELRTYAFSLLAAAEAAESDSMVLRFVTEKAAIPLDLLGGMLTELRRYREEEK